MKKIKTAEEYLDEFVPWNGDKRGWNDEDVEKAINQAQLEMLEYAVNKCARNAEINLSYYLPRSTTILPPEISNAWIDEQSILKTIDEIKKELE